MCWISWIILKDWIVNKNNILKANETMKHRWPDASSFFISENKKIWLWHVRLSIVDLNNRSNQPFQIDNWDYVIVFNWEIYNYESLKVLLENKYSVLFKTTSDTEVLVNMYKYFWKECLNYIEWMFAFVIYNKIKNEIFIARDFAWQKPLVYINDKTWFYFSSEIPALFNLNPWFKKEIDVSTLKFYMLQNFWHIPNDFCAFKNIKKLEKSSYVLIKNWEIVEIWKYDKLQKWINTSWNEIDFLDNKLSEMKPSDIGYASFLSWWIDSSFICNWLKKNEIKKTDAYTLKISNDDEDFERSKFVAKKLDLNHNVIYINDFNIIKSINETISILWEPYFHITSVYADSILEKAKTKHKVFFTWAAWDECYYWYNNILFILMNIYFKIKKILPYFVITFLNKITNEKYKDIFFSDIKTFKKNYYKSNFQKISKIFIDKQNIDNYIDKLVNDFFNFVEVNNYIDVSYMFWLFIENMHSLTIQSDLIWMKNSIEIRALFLEREVIKRAYSIPFRKKVNLFKLNEWKEILRKQLIKIFWKKFIYSKKIWFWVKYNFAKKIEEKYLNLIYSKIKNLFKRWLFDETEVNKLFENFIWNFQIIIKLYTIEIWFEQFIDNK